MNYIPTIGLEIHAELKTVTKMFCSSKNDPDEARPNVNICPVCIGHPGTLPVINKEAVRQVLRVGYAVGGTIADYTEFDRKNYFYPDIPKGYQLSQYQYPLVSGGSLHGVALTRIHLEEDTARSSHEGGEGRSLVDFNRAGVPLMELVTEPVITSAQEAFLFARELQLLLRTLGASDANMEKGEMRVEANVSVAHPGAKEFGTKVEIKNLNSFRSVERAILFEVERQIKTLEAGEIIMQETRGFDEVKGITFSQRSKESSHDYRYFPDPDLPKLIISRVPEFQHLADTLPELPSQRRERLLALGIKAEDAEMYVMNTEYGSYFDAVSAVLGVADNTLLSLASNYISSDLAGIRKTNPQMSFPDATHFAGLVRMLSRGELSSRGAKEVLRHMITENAAPQELAKTYGLMQESDEQVLTDLAQAVITASPDIVAQFKSGKEAVFQRLVGEGIKASGGRANPILFAHILRKLIT